MTKKTHLYNATRRRNAQKRRKSYTRKDEWFVDGVATAIAVGIVRYLTK